MSLPNAQMQDLITRYNYEEFTPPNFEPWMRFDESPPLGQKAPDFPLWDLDGTASALSVLCAQHTYTIVEFGSFT